MSNPFFFVVINCVAIISGFEIIGDTLKEFKIDMENPP
jgi:hypothetical protein